MDLSITYLTSKIDLKTVYYALGCFAAAILCFLASERFEHFSKRWQDRFVRFSSHQNFAICFVMLVPICIRMLALPWHPPPIPEMHDEFGHLFVADTLSHGRLANPKHDLYQAFETQYILQSPSYSSIYPLGKGAFFAIGKLFFKVDWAGVLLEVASMSGAITWMLYGCIRPNWAFLGGLIAAFSYGMNSQWLNSYWGGGGAAFGGALVFGSLCRLSSTPSFQLPIIMGIGWSIVSFIRPFESIFLYVICCSGIGFHISRKLHRWRDWRSIVGLFLFFQILTVGVTCMHNKAVTGSFGLTPYQLSQTAYGVPQSLLFQKPIPSPANLTASQAAMYEWQLEVRENAISKPFRKTASVVYHFWKFFITPWFTLPLCLLLLCRNDVTVVVVTMILFGALLMSRLFGFFFPHYFAPYACLVVYLIVRGLMKLDSVAIKNFRWGRPIVYFCLISGFLLGSPRSEISVLVNRDKANLGVPLRYKVIEKLREFGERHVVFVEYDKAHSLHNEWIYNAADIDSQDIVWCRNLPESERQTVKDYYPGRVFWLARVNNSKVVVQLEVAPANQAIPGRDFSNLPATWSLEQH